MRADEKAMVICNDAGVEAASGAVVLVAVMSGIYNVIRFIGEVAINLFG